LQILVYLIARRKVAAFEFGCESARTGARTDQGDDCNQFQKKDMEKLHLD
jgi:hypothetical protein